LAAAIVGRRGGADRPVNGFVEVAEIERIEKFTRLDGIGDGRVDEIRGETTASERTGRDETLVARRVHLEGRKFNRGYSGGLRRRDGDGLRVELRRGQGRD